MKKLFLSTVAGAVCSTSLAIGGAALVLAATSANAATFSDFPNIGANIAGPAILITLG